jgi:hypothetical protein
MRRLALLTGLLGAPLAWLLYLEINYALVPWACRHGHARHPALYLVAAAALLAALASGALAWREWRLAGRRTSDDPPPSGRAAFMAITGLANSALFALVIVAAAVPLFWMSACD